MIKVRLCLVILIAFLAVSVPVGAEVISIDCQASNQSINVLSGDVYIQDYVDSFLTGTTSKWNAFMVGDSGSSRTPVTSEALTTMEGKGTYNVRFTLGDPGQTFDVTTGDRVDIVVSSNPLKFYFSGLIPGSIYDIKMMGWRNRTNFTVEGQTVRTGYSTGTSDFTGITADSNGVISGQMSRISTGEGMFQRAQIQGDFGPARGTPSGGQEVLYGDVLLNWTNFSAETADQENDPIWVDVWFGTDPDDPSAFTKVVDAGQDVTSVLVDASAEDTYYWRVDFYLNGDPAVVEYDLNGTDPAKYPVFAAPAWDFVSISDVVLPEDLYVDLEDIPNPTFEELMATTIPDGVTYNGPVYGSTIDAKNSLFEAAPYGNRRIENGINIHTLCNSVIGRSSFYKWTRWYQEDGNTQIFRLFPGERNTRNDRADAARVESFSAFHWGPGVGPWNEWTGRYTIVKPHGCAIFQAKNNINDWGIMLNLSNSGDITLNHRRHQDDYVIARNMTGKSFDIRVLDNGRDYMVWLNGELVGTGYYDRPEGTTGFRWGMYDGTIDHDAMIFVSGATVRADVDPNEPYIDDNETPAVPTGLSATVGSNVISLDWNDNIESDLAGYKIYRSVSQSGPFSQIDVIVGNSYYEDTDVSASMVYYYYVTAVDFAGNESSGSNTAPEVATVDAGDDMITWSGKEVDLSPSYSQGYTPSFWTWIADPADGVEFSPNAYVENPTVTITKVTDNPSTVTLTLIANDGKGPLKDTMTIDVYDDACKASVGYGMVMQPGDIDGDCITNLKDLAILAETWLIDTRITGPVINE